MSAVVTLSPYNWRVVNDSYYEAVHPGAYFRASFVGRAFSVRFDLTALDAAFVPAKQWPIIKWQIDEGDWTEYQLVTGHPEVSLAAGLANTSHTVELHLVGDDAYTDRWATPSMSLKITGFRTTMSGRLSLVAELPTNMIIYGDSISEGAWSEGSPTDLTDYSNYQNGPLSYGALVANDFNAEYGVVAFGGQGWDAKGQTNVPDFNDSWGFYTAGVSRLVAGQFDPPPDYIIINHGTNDIGDIVALVESVLGNLRVAAPGAKICVVIPFNNNREADIRNGFNNYQTNSGPDINCKIIDLNSPTYDTTDGAHPSLAGHVTLAGLVKAEIEALFG
jgi:lysophospholipase L1-like esterase